MSVLSRLLRWPFASGVALSLLLVPAIAGLSRLVGLVREVLLSKLLGLGAALDLFVIFTTVPTYALAYIMGPFGIAFYASLSGDGSPRALMRRLAPWALGGGALIALAVFAAAAFYEPRIRMAGEVGAGYWPIALGGALIVPMAVLIGLRICLLHAEKKHNTAIWLSMVQPWIFVALLLGLDLALLAVALWPVGLAYVGSFILAVAIAAIVARRVGGGPLAAEPPADIQAFKANIGLTTLETGGFFANQLLTMFFAGLTGAGGIAANGLVARIMLTPLSLLLSPLFPVLQNACRDKTAAERRRIFLRSYVAGVSLVAALTAGIVLFGDDAIRLLLQRGAFGPEDTARVAALLLPYCVYVILIAANQLCAVMAFASNDGKAYTFIMLGNYVGGNLLKIPMLAHYGLSGVIWAAAASEGVAALANGWRRFAAERESARS